MADFQDISARLKKAIKSSPVLTKAIKAALASYSRQSSSELVVKAVDTAIDTPVQQINDIRIYDLPKRFRFLNYAANHKPRVPQELLSLPIPENDVHSTPVQQIYDKQIYDLPKRLQFLNFAANHKPRVPQELLSLPIPENDVHSKPVICNKCKDVFLRRVYCWLRVQEMNNFKCFHDSPIFGENIVLQRHSINSDSDIAEQQLNSLGVLFDFIEKNYYDFDSVDL